MSLTLVGKKKGMFRLFDEKGNVVVCTAISTEKNVVAVMKTKESDGYRAIQLASLKASPAQAKRISKPLKGHFAKAKVSPSLVLLESRIEENEQFTVGDEIGVDYFSNGSFVDVTGISKGKGHQGVIKRHHFAGGPASHGSGFHRHGGSTGMRTSPGRCLPGQKKSGRMGAEQVTVQNLKVVKADLANSLLLVAGAIPGPRGAVVYIKKSRKKKKN